MVSFFYKHRGCILSTMEGNSYDEITKCAIRYLSDVTRIKARGEDMLREIMQNRLYKAAQDKDAKTLKKLLKEFRKPIVVEINDKL